MLCACSASKDTSTSETEEFTQATESTEQSLEANASQATSVSTKVAEATTTFEYDSINHTITINGDLYTIATDEMNYSGGYMPYYCANSNMENIMSSINNNDLSDKDWRDGFSDDLREKADNSTLLEDFVNNGGKILDYYIINGEFYKTFYDAEIPVVIHYSINGETLYTIWVFYMQAFVEPEESVTYQITDVFHIENLDGYKQKIEVDAPYHFSTYKDSTTFEYDLDNNTITINGNLFDIAEISSDYYLDEFVYYWIKTDMESIMNSINNNNLSDKAWRNYFSESMLTSAQESDLLESFVNEGGKILDYYILNLPDSFYTSYYAEMPVVIQYSIYGETYNVIWRFCMDEFTDDNNVRYYYTSNIVQEDHLDNYK